MLVIIKVFGCVCNCGTKFSLPAQLFSPVCPARKASVLAGMHIVCVCVCVQVNECCCCSVRTRNEK